MTKIIEVLRYAKFIAAAVGGILTSVIVTLPVVPDWLAIVSAVVTAVAVLAIPNLTGADDSPGEHVAE
jgi:hypothetical protein